MKKISMEHLIINLMFELEQPCVEIMCVKRAIQHLVKEENIDLSEEIECILDVVNRRPDMFKIGLNKFFIDLIVEEDMNEYIKQWQIDPKLKEKIKEFASMAKGLNHCGVHYVEDFKSIKSDSSYIDWVCEVLTHRKSFCDTDFSMVKDIYELENLRKLDTFCKVVQNYFTQNLIPSHERNYKYRSYIISHVKDNQTFFIEVRIINKVYHYEYELIKKNNQNDAISFSDIILDVIPKDIERKLEGLSKFREQVIKAKNLKLPYDNLIEILKEIY